MEQIKKSLLRIGSTKNNFTRTFYHNFVQRNRVLKVATVQYRLKDVRVKEVIKIYTDGAEERQTFAFDEVAKQWVGGSKEYVSQN